MSKVGPEEQGQAREEQDRIRFLVITGRTLATDTGRSQSRSRTDETETGKRHDRASEASAGKDKATEGHDRIMPKKDMAELDQGRAGLHAVAQTCHPAVSSRCCQNILWHVSQVVALWGTLRWVSKDRGK